MPTQYDRPFIYTFDADNYGPTALSLTDGQNYTALKVPLLFDSLFELRRVVGVNNVVNTTNPANPGRWQWYNAINQKFIQGPNGITVTSAPPFDKLLTPQQEYPANAAISFDIQNLKKAGNAYAAVGSVPNYYSQVAFQGVRRFTTDSYAVYNTPYKYREVNWTYHDNQTITQAGRVAPTYTVASPASTFYVPVNDYDFQLLYINIYLSVNGNTTGAVLSQNKFKFRLWDVNNNVLMTAPVLDSYINYTNPLYASCFPVPPMLWPTGATIKYELTSLLIDTEIPARVHVDFIGLRRKGA